MAQTILTLKLCNWPCQNGSSHSYTQVMQLAVSEWFELFWHGQLHNLSARMARAILALKSCIRPCQNGSGHSGTQVMQLAVTEWLEPFLHSSHATGRVRMARTILALKSCNLHGCARKARAILALKFGQCMALFACKNGSSHSGTANHI